jgi:ATP-dependent DNA helicase RecG
MDYYLDSTVNFLKGVGPKWGDILNKSGIYKILDLIEFFPRIYEDRRLQKTIESLAPGERAYVSAVVVHLQVLRRGFNKQYILTLKDETGYIFCKFFRMPYRTYFDKFRIGKKVLAFGQIHSFQGKKEIHHPELTLQEELKGDEFVGLLPIYTEKDDLNSKKLHNWILNAINYLESTNKKNPEVLSQFEFLPQWMVSKYNLIPRWDALKQIHSPNADDLAQYFKFRAPCQRRFIFEDFFWLELNLLLRKSLLKSQKAYVIPQSKRLVPLFAKHFPFQFTEDQNKSFGEIQADLASGYCMQRLLQGDVGSGKTAVIFKAVAGVTEVGFQSVLMVPTEILAEQHYKNAISQLVPIGIKTALLTSQTKNSERKKIIGALQVGELDFLIGTHALLEDYVDFKNLALVVVDEQHRFGVEQRQKLKNKSQTPHFLMVTATPIPRTLAMTAYGDLDLSLVRQKPPGRVPIETKVIGDQQRGSMLNFLFTQLQKGRQAYIIYPLVEESEKIPLKDVVSAFESYKQKFPQISWGLLHGQMKGEEKKEVMQKFKAGEFQILLSTTVVEVGVDVPNANLIVVEHAERFGLAQLHQLRGRVGRGEHKSYCVFITSDIVSNESKQRLSKLELTNDGFDLAEWDLELRGPGEFSGTRQSGLAVFNMAHILRDFEIFEEVQKAVSELLKIDPQLSSPKHKIIKKILADKEKYFLN